MSQIIIFLIVVWSQRLFIDSGFEHTYTYGLYIWQKKFFDYTWLLFIFYSSIL